MNVDQLTQHIKSKYDPQLTGRLPSDCWPQILKEVKENLSPEAFYDSNFEEQLKTLFLSNKDRVTSTDFRTFLDRNIHQVTMEAVDYDTENLK